MDTNPPGSKIAPKTFTTIYYVELGKPYVFLVYKVSTPQGEEMTQRVEERIKSERRFVMKRIGVQNLPQSERMQTYPTVFHSKKWR
jgi:hypothetical protein